MKFSNKTLSQQVTQLCLAKGIDHIVISPGSRNAPLTIGFTENSAFHNFSIVDERSAAFFALGIAQQIKRPVALVCTSGSALLNYYPAIAEAFYSNIPLVVLSADRPSHLVGVGDGQTIRQEHVFENHILYSANCKNGDEFSAQNELEINKALNATIEQMGPVHINLPFDEPLYETSTACIAVNNLPPRQLTTSFSSENFADPYAVFMDHWRAAQRKMIVVGVMKPNSIEQKWVEILAQDESVIVLTETTSNLHHELFFPAIDQLIGPMSETELKELQPDLLLTFGGLVVSKKIKAFLRTFSPVAHYHVHPKTAYDTFFKLKTHFTASANSFLTDFAPRIKPISNGYQTKWLEVKGHRLLKHDEYLGEIPFCDFTVFSEVFKSLPSGSQLQLANSATVRYAQLFDLDRSLAVFCNRGTSGIDGSTSTAIGAAVASEQAVVFVTGDLSFFYDSNALWNDYVPSNFRIIVVNNDGGGIFRILPGKNDSETFSTFFETKHGLKAQKLAELHGFEYEAVSNDLELDEAMKKFYVPSNAPKLLEIFTPFNLNDQVLLEYFKHIK